MTIELPKVGQVWEYTERTYAPSAEYLKIVVKDVSTSDGIFYWVDMVGLNSEPTRWALEAFAHGYVLVDEG